MLPELRPARVPFVAGRAGRSECGLACLAMVLGAYGRRVDLDSLADPSTLSDEGIDALSLSRIAVSLGFSAAGVRVERESSFADLPLPAILHWDRNHFVVLEEVAATATVVDPRIGHRRLPLDELFRRSRGIALLLQPCERG